MSFDTVIEFEKQIAEFYGAPYAVATDCCTHAIEICLRELSIVRATIPAHTYLSIPMTLEKLGIDWEFNTEEWKDFYQINGTPIIDAAVLWRQNSYIPRTLMCLSFQYKKHLSLGRGGAILFDDESLYDKFKFMTYDGRSPNQPWKEQDIKTIGYHYYMPPETAQLGLDRLPDAEITTPKKVTYKDYPDLRTMPVFANK